MIMAVQWFSWIRNADLVGIYIADHIFLKAVQLLKQSYFVVTFPRVTQQNSTSNAAENSARLSYMQIFGNWQKLS